MFGCPLAVGLSRMTSAFFSRCLIHASRRLAFSYGDGRGQRESKNNNKGATSPHVGDRSGHGNEAMGKF